MTKLLIFGSGVLFGLIAMLGFVWGGVTTATIIDKNYDHTPAEYIEKPDIQKYRQPRLVRIWPKNISIIVHQNKGANMYRLSNRSKKHREGIHESLIEISDLAIQITKVDFGIPSSGGLRTAVFQNELFLANRSPADGYKILSEHQHGDAIDFYAYVNGRASWEEYHLALVACSFLQSASMLGKKVKWGGLFKNYKDYPHIQRIT